MLNGHEAGNGGYSQASAYGPPRRMSTQLIRMHGLKGGPDSERSRQVAQE